MRLRFATFFTVRFTLHVTLVTTYVPAFLFWITHAVACTRTHARGCLRLLHLPFTVWIHFTRLHTVTRLDYYRSVWITHVPALAYHITRYGFIYCGSPHSFPSCHHRCGYVRTRYHTLHAVHTTLHCLRIRGYGSARFCRVLVLLPVDSLHTVYRYLTCVPHTVVPFILPPYRTRVLVLRLLVTVFTFVTVQPFLPRVTPFTPAVTTTTFFRFCYTWFCVWFAMRHMPHRAVGSRITLRSRTFRFTGFFPFAYMPAVCHCLVLPYLPVTGCLLRLLRMTHCCPHARYGSFGSGYLPRYTHTPPHHTTHGYLRLCGCSYHLSLRFLVHHYVILRLCHGLRLPPVTLGYVCLPRSATPPLRTYLPLLQLVSYLLGSFVVLDYFTPAYTTVYTAVTVAWFATAHLPTAAVYRYRCVCRILQVTHTHGYVWFVYRYISHYGSRYFIAVYVLFWLCGSGYVLTTCSSHTLARFVAFCRLPFATARCGSRTTYAVGSAWTLAAAPRVTRYTFSFTHARCRGSLPVHAHAHAFVTTRTTVCRVTLVTVYYTLRYRVSQFPTRCYLPPLPVTTPCISATFAFYVYAVRLVPVLVVTGSAVLDYPFLHRFWIRLLRFCGYLPDCHGCVTLRYAVTFTCITYVWLYVRLRCLVYARLRLLRLLYFVPFWFYPCRFTTVTCRLRLVAGYGCRLHVCSHLLHTPLRYALRYALLRLRIAGLRTFARTCRAVWLRLLVTCGCHTFTAVLHTFAAAAFSGCTRFGYHSWFFWLHLRAPRLRTCVVAYRLRTLLPLYGSFGSTYYLPLPTYTTRLRFDTLLPHTALPRAVRLRTRLLVAGWLRLVTRVARLPHRLCSSTGYFYTHGYYALVRLRILRLRLCYGSHTFCRFLVMQLQFCTYVTLFTTLFIHGCLDCRTFTYAHVHAHTLHVTPHAFTHVHCGCTFTPFWFCVVGLRLDYLYRSGYAVACCGCRSRIPTHVYAVRSAVAGYFTVTTPRLPGYAVRWFCLHTPLPSRYVYALRSCSAHCCCGWLPVAFTGLRFCHLQFRVPRTPLVTRTPYRAFAVYRLRLGYCARLVGLRTFTRLHRVLDYCRFCLPLRGWFFTSHAWFFVRIATVIQFTVTVTTLDMVYGLHVGSFRYFPFTTTLPARFGWILHTQVLPVLTTTRTVVRYTCGCYHAPFALHRAFAVVTTRFLYLRYAATAIRTFWLVTAVAGYRGCTVLRTVLQVGYRAAFLPTYSYGSGWFAACTTAFPVLRLPHTFTARWFRFTRAYGPLRLPRLYRITAHPAVTLQFTAYRLVQLPVGYWLVAFPLVYYTHTVYAPCRYTVTVLTGLHCPFAVPAGSSFCSSFTCYVLRATACAFTAVLPDVPTPTAVGLRTLPLLHRCGYAGCTVGYALHGLPWFFPCRLPWLRTFGFTPLPGYACGWFCRYLWLRTFATCCRPRHAAAGCGSGYTFILFLRHHCCHYRLPHTCCVTTRFGSFTTHLPCRFYSYTFRLPSSVTYVTWLRSTGYGYVGLPFTGSGSRGSCVLRLRSCSRRFFAHYRTHIAFTVGCLPLHGYRTLGWFTHRTYTPHAHIAYTVGYVAPCTRCYGSLRFWLHVYAVTHGCGYTHLPGYRLPFAVTAHTRVHTFAVWLPHYTRLHTRRRGCVRFAVTLHFGLPHTCSYRLVVATYGSHAVYATHCHAVHVWIATWLRGWFTARAVHTVPHGYTLHTVALRTHRAVLGSGSHLPHTAVPFGSRSLRLLRTVACTGYYTLRLRTVLGSAQFTGYTLHYIWLPSRYYTPAWFGYTTVTRVLHAVYAVAHGYRLPVHTPRTLLVHVGSAPPLPRYARLRLVTRFTVTGCYYHWIGCCATAAHVAGCAFTVLPHTRLRLRTFPFAFVRTVGSASSTTTPPRVHGSWIACVTVAVLQFYYIAWLILPHSSTCGWLLPPVTRLRSGFIRLRYGCSGCYRPRLPRGYRTTTHTRLPHPAVTFRFIRFLLRFWFGYRSGCGCTRLPLPRLVATVYTRVCSLVYATRRYTQFPATHTRLRFYPYVTALPLPLRVYPYTTCVLHFTCICYHLHLHVLRFCRCTRSSRLRAFWLRVRWVHGLVWFACGCCHTCRSYTGLHTLRLHFPVYTFTTLHARTFAFYLYVYVPFVTWLAVCYLYAVTFCIHTQVVTRVALRFLVHGCSCTFAVTRLLHTVVTGLRCSLVGFLPFARGLFGCRARCGCVLLVTHLRFSCRLRFGCGYTALVLPFWLVTSTYRLHICGCTYTFLPPRCVYRCPHTLLLPRFAVTCSSVYFTRCVYACLRWVTRCSLYSYLRVPARSRLRLPVWCGSRVYYAYLRLVLPRTRSFTRLRCCTGCRHLYATHGCLCGCTGLVRCIFFFLRTLRLPRSPFTFYAATRLTPAVTRTVHYGSTYRLRFWFTARSFGLPLYHRGYLVVTVTVLTVVLHLPYTGSVPGWFTHLSLRIYARTARVYIRRCYAPYVTFYTFAIPRYAHHTRLRATGYTVTLPRAGYTRAPRPLPPLPDFATYATYRDAGCGSIFTLAALLPHVLRCLHWFATATYRTRFGSHLPRSGLRFCAYCVFAVLPGSTARLRSSRRGLRCTLLRLHFTHTFTHGAHTQLRSVITGSRGSYPGCCRTVTGATPAVGYTAIPRFTCHTAVTAVCDTRYCHYTCHRATHAGAAGSRFPFGCACVAVHHTTLPRTFWFARFTLPAATCLPTCWVHCGCCGYLHTCTCRFCRLLLFVACGCVGYYTVAVPFVYLCYHLRGLPFTIHTLRSLHAFHIVLVLVPLFLYRVYLVRLVRAHAAHLPTHTLPTIPHTVRYTHTTRLRLLPVLRFCRHASRLYVLLHVYLPQHHTQVHHIRVYTRLRLVYRVRYVVYHTLYRLPDYVCAVYRCHTRRTGYRGCIAFTPTTARCGWFYTPHTGSPHGSGCFCGCTHTRLRCAVRLRFCRCTFTLRSPTARFTRLPPLQLLLLGWFYVVTTHGYVPRYRTFYIHVLTFVRSYAPPRFLLVTVVR